MKHKILFICKSRISYGVSYGLLNSATFVVESLLKNGIDAKVVSVTDNNCIDKEVSAYRPTHVIIEALWVVPEKFEVLTKLHPNVKWYIRLHSKPSFIANEGIAFDWITRLINLKNKNIIIATNNLEFSNIITSIYNVHSEYLPNIYIGNKNINKPYVNSMLLNIGCFGAIRPLKNHLTQALAAIKYANSRNKFLNFYINDRVEQKGEEVMKNLKALFLSHKKHTLITVPWMAHKDFLKIIRLMDIGLQVSLTETYNIVTADFVSQGVPVVVSKEIDWLPFYTKADPTSVNSIASSIATNLSLSKIWSLSINKYMLDRSNNKSVKQWLTVFNNSDK